LIATDFADTTGDAYSHAASSPSKRASDDLYLGCKQSPVTF